MEKEKEYYENGNLKYYGEYLNGKILVGTKYDNDGNIIKKCNFIKGKKEEIDPYSLSVLFIGEYLNGERNG